MHDRTSTLCFSGHRYYDGTTQDVSRLDAALQAAYADGYRTFISGVAPGFDLAAAQAVVRLRAHYPDVRLVAAVPFSGQAKKYDTCALDRYDAILAAADEVKVLSERYSYGCYYRRDRWMVDRSGRIVCWYNGAKTSGGGTRYTVRLAVKAGLEVVNLFRKEGMLF